MNDEQKQRVRDLLKERWPAVKASIKREDFQSCRAWKRKRHWKYVALIKKVKREVAGITLTDHVTQMQEAMKTV